MLFENSTTFKKEIKQTLKIIEGNKNVFIVGGAIRDELLGKPWFDLDLVILKQSNKEDIFKIAKFLKAKIITLGKKEPTYRICKEDITIDVTFISNLKEDAFRRDLTVNALFYSLKEKRIMDYVSGISDIKRMILRAPRKGNIEKDPIRILRIGRLQATHGFTQIAKDTLEEAVRQVNLLRKEPIERIQHEITKLIEGEYLDIAIEFLAKINLFEVLTGSYIDYRSFKSKIKRFKEIKKKFFPNSTFNELSVKLALLATENGSILDKLKANNTIPQKEIRKASSILKILQFKNRFSYRAILGIRDNLILEKAVFLASLDPAKSLEIANLISTPFTPPKPILSAKEIIETQLFPISDTNKVYLNTYLAQLDGIFKDKNGGLQYIRNLAKKS